MDARTHKLLPGDKQLLHLVAKAQRRRVKYTIVITKIVSGLQLLPACFCDSEAELVREIRKVASCLLSHFLTHALRMFASARWLTKQPKGSKRSLANTSMWISCASVGLQMASNQALLFAKLPHCVFPCCMHQLYQDFPNTAGWQMLSKVMVSLDVRVPPLKLRLSD